MMNLVVVSSSTPIGPKAWSFVVLMGVEELTTTKFIIYGNGQIRT